MKIKSFKQWLFGNNELPITEEVYMKRELLRDTKWMNEVMDSTYRIIEKYKTHNNRVDEYLVQTNSMKFYRIYVECIVFNGKTMVDVGFKRNVGKNNWTVDGITNDLSTTELLRLFGTLKKITLSYKPNRIYIRTNNDPEKMMKYMKILERSPINGFKMTEDIHGDFCLDDGIVDKPSDKQVQDIIRFKSKFTVKK